MKGNRELEPQTSALQETRKSQAGSGRKAKAFRWTKKARVFAEAMARMDNVSAAAREAGIDVRYSFRLLKKPELQAEVARRRAQKQAALDKEEAKKIVINRDVIVARLFDLGMLPPLGESQNISGQVKACSEIAEILGMKVLKTLDVTSMFRGRSDEECEYYAAHGFFPGEKPADDLGGNS